MCKKLVSIIIPIYNVEPYLEDCLNSVLAQTYDNMEIICVNDGSLDCSLKILEDYAYKDNRIHIINQTNAGLSAARNTGLRNATGDYIYFIDSDDMIIPNSIKEMVTVAEKYSLDMLCIDMDSFFDNKKIGYKCESRRIDYQRSKEYTDVVSGQRMFALMNQQGDYLPNAVLYFFQRAFLLREGLQFYDGILHEDNLFTFCTMLKAKRVAHRKKTYYLRRVREDSIMTRPLTYDNFKGYLISCCEMMSFAKNIVYEDGVEYWVRYRISEINNSAHQIYSQLSDTEKKSPNWTDDFFTHSMFIAGAFDEFDKVEKEKNSILFSHSFRIGRFFTSPMRKIKEAVAQKQKTEILLRRDIQKAGRSKLYLLGTPDHGNLGDHLIALSEYYFIRKMLSEYKVIEVVMPKAEAHIDLIKRNIRSKDIICLSGGGWLGTKWRHNEEFVRTVIKSFPDNPVIILPQTVYYNCEPEYSAVGVKIYAEHKNLLICVREKTSYDYVIRNGFGSTENVLLMPDFALLYHNYKEKHIQREKIAICLRDDVERVISRDYAEEIRRTARRYAPVISLETNISPKKVTINAREGIVLNKMDEVAHKKLIITDRLHAMIFAAITNTPCLAFDNATYKVSGVYEWIKELDYIRLADETRSIEEQIEELLELKPRSTFNMMDYSEYERNLAERIHKVAKK